MLHFIEMFDLIVHLLYVLFMYFVAKPGNKATESLKKSRDRSTSVDSQVSTVFDIYNILNIHFP